jgi:hypothetical protein
MKICPMGADLFHADGRTGMTKLPVASRDFGNAPKNCKVSRLCFLTRHVLNCLTFTPATSTMIVGRDSSVGIATRYGLDGPEIESRWGVRFSAPVQTGPWDHPASCTVGTGSFRGMKQPGRGVDHPPTFSADVKERVELYFCFPSGHLWHVLG